jgi:ATP-dependent Clp protease ATP-binding subunit ClpA
MYERLTDRARRIMQLANQEAQRLNQEYIGTEHLLLGLIEEGSGIAVEALKNLNIDLRQIRREIEKIDQGAPGDVTLRKLPPTPRLKKILEYAIEEARNLNDGLVGTRHILLGLLREGEGVGAQVLFNLGVKLEDVRAEVFAILGKKDRPAKSAVPKVVPKPPDEDLSALPPETQEAVRELDDAIAKLNREKEEAVAAQDFEKAAMLRDRSDRLRKERQGLIRRGPV